MFGDPDDWPPQDLVGLSAQLTLEMVPAGYVSGVFPMPGGADVHWFSPVERGVLPLDGLRVTRSLRQACRRYLVTVDAAFEAVLAGCADPSREYGWIDDEIVATYTELHRLGLVHSVECWTPEGDLAGGLYGFSAAGLFAGESMFHDRRVGRDASKVALVHLVRLLSADGVDRLLDVQWRTPHLASLGVVEIPREDYRTRLSAALRLPVPEALSHTAG